MRQVRPVGPYLYEFDGLKPVRILGPYGIQSPRQLPNLAAWYDIADTSSMVIDGSNRVSLVADKSGNSVTNCLVLSGTTSNDVSTPDTAALDLGTSFQFDCEVALVSWASGANQTILSKWQVTGNQRSYLFRVLATGELLAQISTDGTSGTFATWQTTAATGFAANARRWVRFLRNGATGQFFTSTDGISWTQLGANVSSGTGAPFNNAEPLRIGSLIGGDPVTGRVHKIIIYSDAGTTKVFDADFSTPAKLASSFVCSTGQTVTINSSGDLGARITGERDLYQGTVSKQPVWSLDGNGKPRLTFDGTDDYLKAPAFSLSQPETVYFVGQQVTWTDLDSFCDGNGDTTNALTIRQRTSSPNIEAIGGSATTITAPAAVALGTSAIWTFRVNGASSAFRVNRSAANTADLGAVNANGFVLGARTLNTTTMDRFANIRCSEIAIFAAAHSTDLQTTLIVLLGRKWNIITGPTAPLLLTLDSPSSITSGPNGSLQSPLVTGTATGIYGTATYSWARISGSTAITAAAATSAATNFDASGADTFIDATFRLTVTDSFGRTATADHNVAFIFGTPP